MVNGTVYYYFEHPITHDREQLGTDKESAIRTGRILNSALASSGIDPNKRTPVPIGMTIEALAKEYRPYAEAKLNSENSKKATRNYIARVVDMFGDLVVTRVTVKDLAPKLDDLPGTTYVKMRTTLVSMFDYALSRGHIPHHLGNVASVIERKSEPKVKRQRLTDEQYRQIIEYHDTPEYLRVAMMLMMQMTTRPIDVVNLKFSQYRDGVLWTKIRKTGKIQGLKLRPQAKAVIDRARSSGIVSPYIVHALPGRHVAKEHRSAHKDHPTQLTTDQISRTFSEIRDALGIGQGKPGTPPTLYEVRSLSARKYKANGEKQSNVQALLAHTDEDMTELYLDERDLDSAVIVAEAGIDA